MKGFVHGGVRFATVGYLLLFFLSGIFPAVMISPFLSLFGLLLLLFLYTSQPLRQLLLPLLLAGLGIALVVFTGSSPRVIWEGFREMSNLIPLILLTPWVGWMINHEPYIQAILQRTKRQINNNLWLYIGIMALAFLSAYFMVMAGLILVYLLLNGRRPHQEADDPDWQSYITSATLRGFTLTTFCSLFAPAFAYTIQGTRSPLLPTFALGISMSLLGFLVSVLFYAFTLHRRVNRSFAEQLQLDDLEPAPHLVWEFLLLLLGMSGLTLLLIEFTSIQILTLVPLVIIVANILYFALKGNLSVFGGSVKRFFTQDLITKGKEVSLILSVGILVAALKQTGVGEMLFHFFLQAVGSIHLSLYISLSLLILFLSFLTIPPIPAIILVSGILTGIPADYSPILIALSLLVGVSLSQVIAPITVALMMLSNINGNSMWQNGFRLNYLYAGIFLLAAHLYIGFLDFFL